MADAESQVREELPARSYDRVIQYSALGSLSELFKGRSDEPSFERIAPSQPVQTRVGRRSMRHFSR